MQALRLVHRLVRHVHRSARLTLLVAIVLLAVAASGLAAAVARADDALNLPSRDASVVLRDLGHGRASFFDLTTNGTRATSHKLWKGKLPVKSTRFVAGDLTKDGFTDVAALVKLRGGKSKLLVFTSNGTRLTPAGKWTGKLDWASAGLAIGSYVPGQTQDIALTTRLDDGSPGLVLFRLAGNGLTSPDVMALPSDAPIGAAMATGDVNGDFHDEIVFLGAGSGGSGSRLAVYVNNDGTWVLQNSLGGTLTAKGAQLACGDVDGDGITEAVALTPDSGASVTTFDCDGDAIVASSHAGSSVGVPSAKCLLGVADLTGDARADLVTLRPKGSKRSTLRVSVSSASGFTPSTVWSGKGAYARSRFGCAQSLPVRVHANVHELSAEAVASISSVSSDGTTFTFTNAPADVVALKQGDVILAQPNAIIPKGIMRKVDSVTTDAGQTVVVTTPATLTDVFEQAEIDVKAPMVPQQAPAARRAAGTATVRADGSPRFTAATITFPLDEKWSDSGDAGKISATLKGKFTAKLECICWIKIHVDWWYVVPTDISVKAGLGIGFDEQFDWKLTVNYSKSIPWNVTLWQMPFTEIPFAIGTIPCWVQPYADVKLKANVDVKAKGTMTYHERVAATLGAEYDDHWKNLTDSTIEMPFPDFNFEKGTVNAKAAFVVEGGCAVYGIFGPDISFAPYIRAHAGIKNNQLENPPWRIFGGVEANAGVRLEIPILDEFSDYFRWEHNWGPWKLWEKELAHGPIDKTKMVEPAFFTSCDADSSWQKGPVTLNFEVFCAKGTNFGHTSYNLDGAGWKTMPLASPEHPVLTVSGEGSHTLEYRSYTKEGDAEDVQSTQVNIDMTKPTIACSGVDPLGTTTWHGSPVTVALHAADSGGAGILYSHLYVNGAPIQYPLVTDATHTIAVDGDNIIAWQVYDRAYNCSTTAIGELRLDLLPPITIVSGADNAWHTGPVPLTFSATDVHGKVAGSGVDHTEYRLGHNGAFGAWTTGASVTVTGNGDHEVQYRSVDKVGHVEDAKSVHVKIDTSGGDSVAPTTTVSSYPTGWNRVPVTLTFSATDPSPSSGLDYTESKIDAGAWVKGTTLTVGTDGDHTVLFRSADLRQNVETANSCEVKVDQTAPTCAVMHADGTTPWSSADSAAWHHADVTLTFVGADATSGVDHVQYRVDGGTWTTGTSASFPATQHLLHDYVVGCRATDVAGNTGAVKTVRVKIDSDNVAPTCTITGTFQDDNGQTQAWVPNDWYNRPVTLTFAATDSAKNPLPTEYSTDDGATWVAGSSLVIAAPGTHENDGAHTVWCRATDMTGNTGDTDDTIQIDTTPPTTDVKGTFKADDGTTQPWVEKDKDGNPIWYKSPVTLTLGPSDPLPSTADTPGYVAESSGIDHLDAVVSPGTMWLSIGDKVGATVLDVTFDGATAWAATGGSSLKRSTDGGSTWDDVSPTSGKTFSCVANPAANTIYAAGQSFAKSTDGGAHWTTSQMMPEADAGPVSATGLLCAPGSATRTWALGSYYPAGSEFAEGGVFYTSDGGQTWSHQSGPVGTLTDIACAPDGQSLWLVNTANVIFHTTDGGANWSRQTSPLDIDSGHFVHVACVDAQHAWAFTSNGVKLQTTNGGTDWQQWSLPSTLGYYTGELFDIAPVVDSGNVSLVGLGDDGAPFVMGDYGGDALWAYWDADTVASLGKPLHGAGGYLHSGIVVRDDWVDGYAWDGAGRLLKLHDPRLDHLQKVDLDPSAGGTATVPVTTSSWNYVSFQAADKAGNVETKANGFPKSVAVNVDMVPPYTATYGASAQDNPGGSGLPATAILPFPNPGTWWEYLTPYWFKQDQATNGGTSLLISALSFSDQHHGVAGWQDTATTTPHSMGVQVTADGKSWQQSQFVSAYVIGAHLTGVACATSGSTTRAYATGAYASQPYRVRTDYHCVWSLQTSGWTKVTLQQDDSASGNLLPAVNGVACPASNTSIAWVVGTNGRIWRTTDGGADWSPPTSWSANTLTGVCAYSTTQAWAVGYNGTILRTTNGGNAWAAVSSPTTSSLTGVSCALTDGKLNVWAFGAVNDASDVIVHSTDGGQTWTAPQTVYLDYHHLTSVSCAENSVFFADDTGRVWRRTYDTTTGTWPAGWTEITKSGGFGTTYLSLAAISDDALYAAGSGGDVWATTCATPKWLSALPPAAWDNPPISGATYSFFSEDNAGNKEPVQTWTAP